MPVIDVIIRTIPRNMQAWHFIREVFKYVLIGDHIIRIARRERADLIVCGAYGHARAREWVFGGVTQDLINKSPVCCLMSH